LGPSPCCSGSRSPFSRGASATFGFAGFRGRFANPSDPNKIEIEHDAERREKIAASSLRILLSAAHGLHDLEHYLLRFFIAFVVALLMMLALLALIAGITSL
jgi:hypothetical protein